MFVDLVGIAAKHAHILVDSFGTGKQVPVIDYTAALIGPSVDIADDDIVAAFAVDTVSVVETADVDMEATEAVVAVGKSPLAADSVVIIQCRDLLCRYIAGLFIVYQRKRSSAKINKLQQLIDG
nr:hypothetical protein Iba_chr14cCG0720 [Ipomoea batatas]